jgi:hypothetical protein
MKVQIVTSYRVIHLQHYGVTICGNVTSVHPPLEHAATGTGISKYTSIVPKNLKVQVTIYYRNKNIPYLDNTYSDGGIALLSQTLPQFLHVTLAVADNSGVPRWCWGVHPLPEIPKF